MKKLRETSDFNLTFESGDSRVLFPSILQLETDSQVLQVIWIRFNSLNWNN